MHVEREKGARASSRGEGWKGVGCSGGGVMSVDTPQPSPPASHKKGGEGGGKEGME